MDVSGRDVFNAVMEILGRSLSLRQEGFHALINRAGGKPRNVRILRQGAKLLKQSWLVTFRDGGGVRNRRFQHMQKVDRGDVVLDDVAACQVAYGCVKVLVNDG